MSLDLLIPFGILLVLVIYLIYSRTKFEKEIVELYETKFDEWKKNSTIDNKNIPVKKLVGLVFKTDYKLSIELIDKSAEYSLQRGKFEIKEIKDN